MLFKLKLLYSFEFLNLDVHKWVLFNGSVGYNHFSLLPEVSAGFIYFNFSKLLDLGNFRFDWHWMLLWLIIGKAGKICKFRKVLKKGISFYRIQFGVDLGYESVLDFIQIVKEYLSGRNSCLYYGDLNYKTVLYRVMNFSVFNNFKLIPGVFFFRVLEFLNCNFIIKNGRVTKLTFFFSLFKLYE